MRIKSVFLTALAVSVTLSFPPGNVHSGTIKHISPHIIRPLPAPPGQTAQGLFSSRWRSSDVITALKDHGLEVVDLDPGLTITAFMASESTVFLTPSYGNDIGGMVSSYKSEDGLNESESYYSAMTTDPASRAWWVFKKDNILLLISGRVPEEKAREYENVLRDMGKK